MHLESIRGNAFHSVTEAPGGENCHYLIIWPKSIMGTIKLKFSLISPQSLNVSAVRDCITVLFLTFTFPVVI